MTIVKNKKPIIIFLWILILLWLVLIFILSDQPAVQSKGFSEKVTQAIIGAIAWITHVEIDTTKINGLVTEFHHLVRKFAHGWIYFVLGMLVIATFCKTGIKSVRSYVFAILFCFSYAAMDEIHQTFVSGRGGQLSDVLIDTTGAIFGIGLYWMYNVCVKRDGPC